MRKFHTKFSERNLTGNAGLLNPGKFAEKLALPNILASHLSIVRGSTADYQVSEVVMMLIMGAVVGVKHMSYSAHQNWYTYAHLNWYITHFIDESVDLTPF